MNRTPTLSTPEIEAWLVARISSLLGIDATAINRQEPFTAYGLTSKDAVALSGELEDFTGITLSPTILYECPNVESLAHYLSTGEHEFSLAPEPQRQTPERSPIAIVGIGCRFPGAKNLEEFWHLLRNGVDAISELPATRRELQGRNVFPKTGVDWGGFLDQIDQFDAHTFGISPHEAEQMDPQQRILLEIAWEALEDAGIAATKLRGQRAGVFIGISTNDYGRLELTRSANVDAYAATGNALSIAANRLSYYFDLRGPSLTIDTACSSSLVAVHLACQSLWKGESVVALAGGVNVILTSDSTVLFSKAGLMAADGRCKVLDAGADGYVRSEGAGVVILKPLAQALADGDSIYATIRGSAVNQDGRTSGLTAPSRQAQEALLRDAYHDANVSPAQVQYVEMHGTGTALGDPIETKSLGAVLTNARSNRNSCAIGSVKSNIGHLEAAAGIAGLIKVALALKHREIPPTIHFNKPNPHIPFGDLSLQVQQQLGAWPRNGHRPLAGVSAFGFGGTNAHVVLEEAPQEEATTDGRKWQVLPLSAKTSSALDKSCERLQTHLQQENAVALADVAYTLQTGRREFRQRRAVICRDGETAVRALSGSEITRVVSGIAGERKLPVVMLFSGVGEQYEGMVQGLYESEPAFRAALDHCCVELQPHLGRDLREWLVKERAIEAGAKGIDQGIDLRRLLARGNETEKSELRRTLYAQPAMFAVSYALTQLLAEWGLRPQAMLGYSLGEYVAATAAGVLRVEDALMLVARRARMIEEQVQPGGMLAVPLNSDESVRWLVAMRLQHAVSVAVRQGERVTVLGGGAAELNEVEQRLSAAGIVSRRVQTDHAFHTKNLEVVREQFEELMRGVEISAPQVPYVSNLTGNWIRDDEVQDVSYWGRQMCETVELGRGLDHLLEWGEAAVMEVGAGGSLSAVLRQCRGGAERVVVTTLPGRGERQSDEEQMARSVARLWVAGVEVDWKGYHAHERRRRVTLPTYPFERQRYWIEVATNHGPPIALPGEQLKQLSKKADIADWFYVPVWKESALAPQPEPAVKKTNWLIFSDEAGLGTDIAHALRNAGHSVAIVKAGVKAGVEFSRPDSETFVIDPASKRHYDSVLDELPELPNRIVHAWSVDHPCSTPTADTVQEDLKLGFYSLLYLTQALGERALSQHLDVAVLSSEMQSVTGYELLRLGKATILGAVKVIPLEYEQLSCASIDVDQDSLHMDQREALTQRLISELCAPPSETLVAYRSGRRFIQQYEAARNVEPAKEVLRERGVYLLTGGTGGLGLALAEHLAERVRARLVLIGRTALPPREQWQTLLSDQGTTAIVARRIRAIMSIEEKGGEVLVLNGDISDTDQCRQLIDRALAHFGEINGVIHAAAVPGEGLIQMKTPEKAAAVLAPKISGTLALAEVLKDKPLDFCVLFSSLAAVTGGGPGQVDYAAANAFLDAFAHANNVISINWAEWQWNAWAEHLNGFDARIQNALKTHRQELGITFREGVQAFEQALALNRPRVIVSPVEIDALVEQSRSFTVGNVITQFAPAATSVTHARPPIATTFVPATNELERTIAGVWQSALGISSVGVDDNFFDLGGTSLIGLQIVSQLRNSLGIEIPAIALYEAPTIRALVKLLGPGSRTEISVNRKRKRKPSQNEQNIAIVGMAGRFPGAQSVDELWRNLIDGTESITFFSDQELIANGVNPTILSDPNYVKAGAVLSDIDTFDAGLFGYSPREAEMMDPQHRLFLECAWAALEDAGYDSERYTGSIGVFGGSNMSTYLSTICAERGLDALNLMQLGLGNSNDSLTTKVSYKLNLRGPSVAVQTFCSTSAVAVHMACRSLLAGECDMALGGGVRVAVPHRVGYLYERGNIDSPDGHCRAFDSKGQGSVLGNGVALVVLKRLPDALADGDHIYAVIKASAINNDGSSKAGYTAPSVDAQAEVVATALAEAGVAPSEIGYIEAHGTATELGDPIEIAALTKAFGNRSGETASCAIGSIKTNLGHLDRAAGVTGIIKTALALEHGLIPPSLNFSEPNPQIDFRNSPFFVNTQLRKWKSNGTPRRAGVNSLGIGGTNVHFILEQPPRPEESSRSRSCQILTLTANTAASLDAARKNLVEYLRSNTAVDLADVAYTLQVGRRLLDHKLTLVCSSVSDAIGALENDDPKRVLVFREPSRRKPLVMVFSGEQYEGIGELYEREARFREVLDQCCVELQPHLGRDLREWLVAGKAIEGGPRYEQPAVFVVSYAVSQLLLEWGLRPQAVLGYGVGEYVAATVAGVMQLEDALRLVAGCAESVPLKAPQVAYVSSVSGEWVQGEIAEASYWGEQSCTAAGIGRGLERLLEWGDAAVVEVGVGDALRAAVQQCRGGAGRVVVQTLGGAEQLARSVAQLWVAGVEVNWEGYHARERRRRVALPTYPFERQRYWLAMSKNDDAAGALPAEQLKQLSKKADIADWFYVPTWKESALAPLESIEEGSVWLTFADDYGLAEKIAEHVRVANIVVVRRSTSFTKLDDHTYTIDPGRAEDYHSLIQALVHDNKTPTKIVHLWNVDSTANSFEEAQLRGFYSLVYLAQALSEQRVTNAVTIDVIASDASPEKATLLGPCKVIPQEYPSITCRYIEIKHDPGEETVVSLCNELAHAASDPVVSYAGTRRFVQTFEPLHVGAVTTPPAQLRKHGTYLITGGLGGVGFSVARFLAENVQANLVLTGRASIPAEELWDQWLLDHEETDAVSQKIHKVRTLRDLGARVLVLSADVADEGRMREVVTQIESEFGTLNGIIHAAGIVSVDAFRAIQQIDQKTCERHFRPKVHGLYVLQKIVQERDVDFCFLLSSLSAVLGGIGFVAYAAANIFMDRFAENQNRAGRTRWISVNWDTWKTSDDEHREARLKGLEKTVAEFALTTDEGLDAFQRILSAEITHVVNSTGDLQARIDQWITRQPLVCNRAGNQSPSALYARPNLQNVYVPVSNEAEEKIAAILQRVLGIDRVGIHDNYFELGGTSLTAIQVVAELQREFNTPISPVMLFESPTVSQIAKALTQPASGPCALQLEVTKRRQTRARAAQGDLAIVGMSCRFPGAKDVDQFWENLKNGVESVSFFEDQELLESGIDADLLRDPNYVRARPIIDDVDQFDAEFFGYSAREADFMDPQHRLLMETAWQALENAGYDSQRYRGAIGVFAGSNISTYALNVLSDKTTRDQLNDLEAAIAFDRDSLTTRVSYKLNLRGPSFAVQTFCSTSLVAVHLACQSLYSGECDMALAGGVSVRVPQKVGYRFEAGGQDSPDGHTRTFDAKARGTVFGDGVGVVVLKRLDDAIADGDQICAVIRGSAINNDGSVKVGYTAPSVEGQAAVIANALANASVEADSIGYVEAHGTATELGDPIEVAALSKAFRINTPKSGYCAIGSVKSNMGHLDRAAGVAGLIKTILSLKHRLIPPTLYFEQSNPQIDFPSSPFFVNTQLRSWERNGTPRRAGVNSLGVGGTNVHVVLEEAPQEEATTAGRKWQVLPVSAKTAGALDKSCERLQTHLQHENAATLADVAYTLQVGRREFRYRRAGVCGDGVTAMHALNGTALNGVAGERKLPVVMVFSGEGEQYERIASELYESEQRFREVLDQCCVELQRYLGRDLREWLVNGQTIEGGPRYEQPALFVVGYALTQLLAEWGVRPQALLGYGVGEYVAATVAGVLKLEDALRLVVGRAELLAQAGDRVAMREQFEEQVRSVPLNAPQIPYVSSVSGEWVKGVEITEPDYWSEQLCTAAEPGRGLERLLEWGEAAVVEVGAGGGLDTLVRHFRSGAERVVVQTLGGAEQLARNVAQLWVAGVEVDWEGYHARERRRRVALPTYPFERQRYWIDVAKNGDCATALPAEQLKQLSKKEDIADWFYLPVWKQAPLTEEPSNENGSCYLVLQDTSSIGETVVQDLESHGKQIISVQVGPEFVKLTDSRYAIDPGNRHHYDLLINDLNEQNKIPQQILHFWSLTNDPGDLNEVLRRGFYSLLHLMQAIGERVTGQLQITVVTSGLHKVIGDEEISPANGTITGPCTVIPLEYENTRCRLIDLVRTERDNRRIANQILDELLNGTAQDLIAYRGGSRWVRVFEPVKLRRKENKHQLLREGGVYLITGGLGGIGLAVAKHLATTVKAKLILIGRSGLPDVPEWPRLLASENGSRKVADKIRQVEELKALGAEVLVIRADVTDAEQMRSAVTFATERFGEINGVFHAAGTPAAGLIRLKTQQMAEAVLAPKVLGTMVLDELFAGTPLDFMLLFSSMTSITGGGPGQADYCAANAFLDAYANAAQAQKRQVISVNWGEWLWDAWQEGLLSFDPMVQAFFKENRKEFGISFEDGMDALDRILSSKFRQLVVSTQDFNRLVDLSKSFTVDRILQEVLSRRANEQVHPRPSLGTSYVAPRSETEVRMAKLWAELLRLERVGIYDNFFELGGNSLLGVNLISQLRTTMGAEIPVYALYEAPTVEAFARIITSQNDEHSLDDRVDRGEMRRLRHQQRREVSRLVV